MREKLKTLVEIARIDNNAADIEAQLGHIPEQLREAEEDLARLEALLQREQEELEGAEKLRVQHEQAIADSNENLTKAKSKGAKARNAREVEAVEKEMEVIRRQIRDREDEQAKLKGVLETAQKTYDEHVAQFEALKADLDNEHAEAKATLADLDAKRAVVTEGREALVEALADKVLLRKYERIREKKGEAVVAAENGICTGCRVSLRPQHFIQLQRVEEIEQCPQCGRIIYHAESLGLQVEAQAAPAGEDSASPE